MNEFDWGNLFDLNFTLNFVLVSDGSPSFEMFAFGFDNFGRVLNGFWLVTRVKNGQIVGSNAESTAIRQILNLILFLIIRTWKKLKTQNILFFLFLIHSPETRKRVKSFRLEGSLCFIFVMHCVN